MNIGAQHTTTNLNQKDMTGAGQSADGVKFLWNGHIYISKHGMIYDVLGQQVRLHSKPGIPRLPNSDR
jgi:hypothetical protein